MKPYLVRTTNLHQFNDVIAREDEMVEFHDAGYDLLHFQVSVGDVVTVWVRKPWYRRLRLLFR